MLEKKHISKENWQRVIDRKYLSCNIIENQKNIGVASLLHIKKIDSPLVKSYKDIGNLKIADKDYYWLQIALKNTNYWITAMYDENKKLVQYYIDITDKNIINSKDDAYFYDLFLDVVFFNNDKTILLDETELIDALNSQIINKQQYNLAYTVANNILKNIKIKKQKLNKFCFKYLEKLDNEMR